MHDPRDHRFWIGEQELCGATRVLRLCGLVDDSFYTDESSVRGRHVHAATVMIDWGQEIDIDPRLVGYCAAYRKFLDVERPTYADNGERLTANPDLLLAGIIDRRVTRMRRIAQKRVLEFKTCETFRPTPWHRWQLALYMLCEPDYVGTDAVYLLPDGNYRLESFDKTWRQDRDVALHAAALIKARFTNGDRSIFYDAGDTGRVYTNGGEYVGAGANGPECDRIGDHPRRDRALGTGTDDRRENDDQNGARP